MITLTDAEWRNIRNQIRIEYADKPSVWLLRSVMKRELGFTDRHHQVYKEQTGYITTVYLDFFNDAAETMFRLKYL